MDPVDTSAQPGTPPTLSPADSPYRFLLNPWWPDARWDVSGAFSFDNDLVPLYRMIFGELGIEPFSSVHGAPLCLWGGGRFKWQFHYEPADIQRIVKMYADAELPLRLTFSNSSLVETDLRDPRGNFILDGLSRLNPTGENGVILCSDLLRTHIRRHFPDLKLVASLIKITGEDGKGNLDYYRRLADVFDKVMIHPDDNFKLDLLAKIENKDRYEIMVNGPCVRDCPMRKKHFRLTEAMSRNPLDSNAEEERARMVLGTQCFNLRQVLLSTDRRTSILSDNEIRRLYDMGFRNFKIQGRCLGTSAAILIEIFRLVFNHDPDCSHLSARLMMGTLARIGNSRESSPVGGAPM